MGRKREHPPIKMVDLCLNCPNRGRCTYLCYDVRKFVKRAEFQERGGNQRIVYLGNVNNCTKADVPTTIVDMRKAELTERQHEILLKILQTVPKESIRISLDISKWVMNKEIREIRAKIQGAIIDRELK